MLPIHIQNMYVTHPTFQASTPEAIVGRQLSALTLHLCWMAPSVALTPSVICLPALPDWQNVKGRWRGGWQSQRGILMIYSLCAQLVCAFFA